MAASKTLSPEQRTERARLAGTVSASIPAVAQRVIRRIDELTSSERLALYLAALPQGACKLCFGVYPPDLIIGGDSPTSAGPVCRHCLIAISVEANK